MGVRERAPGEEPRGLHRTAENAIDREVCCLIKMKGPGTHFYKAMMHEVKACPFTPSGSGASAQGRTG